MSARPPREDGAPPDLRAMLSRLLHDVRGPARRVRTFGELVAEDLPPEADADGSLSFLVDSARQLQRRLTALGRLSEALLVDGALQDLDLHELLVAHGSTHGLELQSPGPGCQVRAVPELVVALLDELLDNATRWGGESPAVLVLRSEGGLVIVEVIDRGPGIEPHLRERAFLPFETLGCGDRDGLGLTVVALLADRLGATVRLASGEPGGLRAIIEFDAGGEPRA